MSVKVMTWVWEHSQAKGVDRLVLLAIADAADDAGNNAWPSIATIARKCGNVSGRTVQRAVQSLADLGELVVEEIGNGRRSNHYRVTMRGDNLSPLTDSHPRQAVTPGASESHPRGDKGVTQPVLEPSLNRPGNAQRSTDEAFEDFWRVYPRRVGKRGARLEFERALKRAPLSVILSGAVRYRDDPNRQAEFTKHPSTWLHQDCWSDEPLPARMKERTPDDLARERVKRRQDHPLASAL